MQNLFKWTFPLLAAAGAAGLIGCASLPGSGSISKLPWGKTRDGVPVYLYTLRNANGMEARICTFGGIVQSLKVPDRDGRIADVVLGYDNLGQYLTNATYFGALIGRYANRIARGRFTLDGVTYRLATNDYPNALHGGVQGFDKRVWTARGYVTLQGPSLELSYLSWDGEEGYPGNLSVKATYTLTKDNALRLTFKATTDKDTIVNLTQHSYFNLSGQGNGTILHDVAMIRANTFTPVDSTLIPTGKFQSVTDTPFDFRIPTAIGKRINENNEQLKFAHGYDDNFVINKPMGQLGLMARVYDPASGRVLEALSTEPGLQFYTGNFLNGGITGKDGKVYVFRGAFTLEPQHYPDSPNHPNFPSVVLRPGDVYHNTIVYRFSVQ
jgi:aldose 1-epimerase